MTLAAEGVTVARKALHVLEDVDFTLAPGEIVAIVGPNGAGKSTLLKVLAGLLPAAGGMVTLSGRQISTWPIGERARRIAYLPQDRHVAWPLNVSAVVGLGRLPYRRGWLRTSPADAAAVDAALTAMDVADLADRPINELSGGERGRVLVARALAQGADHLLADEPTAGLDPAHALRLFAHLARLADGGRAVAVATHDLTLAARYAHRVLLLANGRVLALDEPTMVLTEERLARAFAVRAVHSTIGGVPVVVPIEPLT